MLGKAIGPAVITGVFCALFALVLSRVAPQLSMNQLLMASFVSVFLGSITARVILRK